MIDWTLSSSTASHKVKKKKKKKKKQPSWLAQLHRAGSRGGGKTYKKRSQNLGASLPFSSFGSACPYSLRMYFPLLANKIEL